MIGNGGDRGADRWLRAGYLGFFGALGAFVPFAALFFRDLGMGGFQVGVLAALPAVAVAVCGPYFASVADARGIHRPALRASLALAALFALAASQLSTFTALVVAIGLFAVALAPIAALFDGYALTLGGRRDRSYGGIRVWGSIGYTAVVLATGRLMGARVSPLFLVATAACLGLAFLVALRLPPLRERRAIPLRGGLRSLLRRRSFALLLVVSYLTSSGAAVMYAFLGIRLQELGGSADLVGAAFALGTASELPVIAFGGLVLARLGASRLLGLAIIVYAARLVAYSELPSPVWVLPVQALHGLSYGAFLTASVARAHRLAGPEHAATAQALLAAASFGCGSITGSLIGGALLDRIGTVGLFRGAAVVMLLALGAFLLSERLTDN